MDRVIFDESATDWPIKLQSSNNTTDKPSADDGNSTIVASIGSLKQRHGSLEDG
jgi:hypothetical protein